MDNPHGLASQGVRIRSPTRDETDAKTAADRVQLVSDAQHRTGGRLREGASGISGHIVLLNRPGYSLGLP